MRGTQEIIYFRQLLLELGFPQEEPSIIYADNASMITLATDFSGNHKRVKHYITRINFLIEQVRDRVVSFTHVGTKDNVADILIKPLCPMDFLRLRPRLLGMKIMVPSYERIEEVTIYVSIPKRHVYLVVVRNTKKPVCIMLYGDSV